MLGLTTVEFTKEEVDDDEIVDGGNGAVGDMGVELLGATSFISGFQ